MSRLERHVEDFRYHVQDAMYSEGFHRVMGEQPEFVFLAVSTSVNCGRYPVRVRPSPTTGRMRARTCSAATSIASTTAGSTTTGTT